MQMIETRNITTHTYDKNIVESIVLEIVEKYYKEFKDFECAMDKIKDEK